MTTIPVYDKRGTETGTMEIDETSFGEHVKHRLLKDALVAYESGRHQGTACTKERGDVAGSTSKPWRQKGTGRARAGSRKSPIWRGGGVVFGPRPHDFRKRMLKKARRKALDSALLLKIRKNRMKVVEGIDVPEPKTKDLDMILGRMAVKGDALIVVSQFDRALWLSARNLPSVDVVTARGLNARIVAARRVLVVARDAVADLSSAGGSDSADKDGETVEE